jgi:hypothetical protein
MQLPPQQPFPAQMPLYNYGRPIEVSNVAQAESAIKQMRFLVDNSYEDQIRLCKERMRDCLQKLIEVIKSKKWPLGIVNNFLVLPRVCVLDGKPWDRIGLAICPDSYELCYMETALLQRSGEEFIDALGYKDGETKKWLVWNDLLEEISRLLEIFQQEGK